MPVLLFLSLNDNKGHSKLHEPKLFQPSAPLQFNVINVKPTFDEGTYSIKWVSKMTRVKTTLHKFTDTMRVVERIYPDGTTARFSFKGWRSAFTCFFQNVDIVRVPEADLLNALRTVFRYMQDYEDSNEVVNFKVTRPKAQSLLGRPVEYGEDTDELPETGRLIALRVNGTAEIQDKSDNIVVVPTNQVWV